MFFFFLLSSDRLAQYCVNLSRWFTHKTAFYTEQCTTPSLFHNFEVSQGAHSHSLKNYDFQLGTPFFLYYTCAFKDHLATIRNCYSRNSKLSQFAVYLGVGSKKQSMRCCQLNQALGKTEVGPYHKYEYIWMIEWSIIHAFWMPGSVGTPGL